MTRYRFQHWTAAVAPLIVVLASCGLTACGSSSDPPPSSPARSSAPSAAAIQAKRHAATLELVACARSHGIHLPPPTERGVNVSGVKGASRERAVSDCYQKAIKKAERAEQAAKTEK